MLKNGLCAFLWTSMLIMGLTGCGSGDVQVSASGAQLVALSITPSNASIAKNTNQPFTATGIYSDNTTQDLTTSVTWTSADSNIAMVDNSAETSLADALMASSTNSPRHTHTYFYGRTSGRTTIYASWRGTSGSATLTVTPATLVSMAVTPPNSSIADGTSQQFTATGTFSDNTTQDITPQVTWGSSDSSVAAISKDRKSVV